MIVLPPWLINANNWKFLAFVCTPNTPHFVVEAVERFGTNVLGFQVATGERRWYIVGAYIAPEDEETMEKVVTAIGRKPRGAELMVAGNFNANIKAPEGNRRAENIASDIATAGLEDMAQHLMPRRRRWNRDRPAWDMRRKGQVVRSRTDYIMGTDSRLSRMSLSGTPGTTRTIKWSLVACRVHPCWRQSGTWGDASGGTRRSPI